MTTLSGPLLRSGSSVVTFGSGAGRKAASWAGFVGSVVSKTWRPAACQLTSATWAVTVGLCDDRLPRYLRSSGIPAQAAGSLYGRTRYSETILGAVSSEMSTRRTQPQGQPASDSIPP